ncbi:MAG: hypothetical protein COA58_01605 [Bacteroidetes bacterium]|nr:MAG: hypothetical protein COA58_01605 [Bacteroidota bacterium]
MLDQLEDENSLSIKEIYEKIIYFGKDIVSKWYLIALIGSIGASSLWLYAYTSDAHFEANLSYVVKGKSNTQGNFGIESVLGQLGWGGSQGTTNLDKVKKIVFSKSVLKEALYDSVTIEGNKDLLANHIAEIYGLVESWAKSGKLEEFGKFETGQKYNDSSIIQNMAFAKVLNLVRGSEAHGNILTVSTDDNIDLMKLNVRSLNEELSYQLSMSVFNSLNNFYLQDEETKSSNAIKILKSEADSVSRLLKAKEYQLANAQDRNYGIILSKNQVNQDEMQRDIQVLTVVYAQMRQNLEMSQFGLNNTSSMFDVLEHPVLPLGRRTKKPIIYSLIGLSMGILAGLMFLILRRFLLDALA